MPESNHIALQCIKREIKFIVNLRANNHYPFKQIKSWERAEFRMISERTKLIIDLVLDNSAPYWKVEAAYSGIFWAECTEESKAFISLLGTREFKASSAGNISFLCVILEIRLVVWPFKYSPALSDQEIDSALIFYFVYFLRLNFSYPDCWQTC